MINVAFIAPQSTEWMGGVNYYKNLFIAISKLEKRQISPIVFLGKKTSPKIIDLLRPHAMIVTDAIFDKWSTQFIVAQFLANYVGWPILHDRLFKKYNVNVVHIINRPIKGLKLGIISWIPDFQHFHLRDNFSNNEIKQRNRTINLQLKKSDAVILSSQDAFNDCLNFNSYAKNRLHVLQFVSQPNPEVFKLERNYIKERHTVPEKYFYLPNQLWKHKNHLQVFEAIKNLKTKGLEINLVCSGSMHDYRDPHYIEEVKSYITVNNLETNIKLLGFIDYLDVLYFIRYSVAVINPSLFEGWSSTVEECKSIGKSMILSNLKVHKEQNPNNSWYFELDDVVTLENCLRDAWLSNKVVPDKKLENEAFELLSTRTEAFAECFQSIVLKACNLNLNDYGSKPH